MQQTPLVSVIIPCYNYGRFLNEALDSVMAQTYSNWECIIVNDGSKDNTEEVALKYVNSDSRFIYIHQENKGVSVARNIAIARAKGEYIQLLDGDDLLEADKLALHVTYLKNNPTISLIYSDILIFNNVDSQRKLIPFELAANRVSGKGKILLDELVKDIFFLPGCALFTSELAKQVGSFKEGLRGFEDWHYWYRAVLLGFEFFYDNRPGTRLLSRSHGSNTTGARNLMWEAKVVARQDITTLSKKLMQQGRINLEPVYLAHLHNIHNALLNRDKARYNLFYENIMQGMVSTFKHAYYSKRPYFAFYDSAYWLKERIKAKF